MYLEAIDVLIMIIYGLLIIGLGIYLGKTNESQEDYFVGNRSFKWWAIGLSVIATQVSAITFIGAPGWAYQSGLVAIIMTMNIPIAMWLIGGYFAPYFYNSGVMSVYSYLEKRFGNKIRLVMSLSFIFKMIMVIGTIVYAPALILSKITGLGLNITIAIMTIISIFYTILGGIKAVIWTDVIQMVVLWLGLIVSFFIIITSLPQSFTETIQIAREAGKIKALDFRFGFDIPNTVWAGIFGGGILHLAYFGVDQAQVQRFLTAKSMRNVKITTKFSSFVVVIQMFVFMLMGSLLYVFYNGQSFDNPNNIFLKFILENIPNGILGLIIAALFAATMSSIDSALNSITTVLVKDIYERYFESTYEKSLKISRIFTCISGIFIAAFAFLVSNTNLSLLEAISKYGSYLLGSMLGVFVLGLFTKSANEKGTILGFFIGVFSVSYIAQNTNTFWMWNNLIGLIVTFSIGYIISYLLGGETKDIDYLTIPGQSEYFKNDKLKVSEEGYFIQPGKFEKGSYILLIYFVITMSFLYFFA